MPSLTIAKVAAANADDASYSKAAAAAEASRLSLPPLLTARLLK
jgi:hypothetical protein